MYSYLIRSLMVFLVFSILLNISGCSASLPTYTGVGFRYSPLDFSVLVSFKHSSRLESSWILFSSMPLSPF